MTRGFAIALHLAAAASVLWLGVGTASAQQLPAPAQCDQFRVLSIETQKKADAVQAAMKAKTDRKQICALMTTFVTAEATVVKFLQDNKTWCGVPDEALTVSTANHEKSLKFRAQVCADDEPHLKAPSLSDAIKTPAVDSSTNTKTGGYGTFDSLTGNPLGK
jgi:hypothetical protein